MSPLAQVLAIETKSLTGDQFGELFDGCLTVKGSLFQLSSTLASITEDIYNSVRYDEWAIGIDAFEDWYSQEETWFLPLALAQHQLCHRNLNVCGLLLQPIGEDARSSVFRRVGFCIGSNDGSIAMMTHVRLAGWAPLPLDSGKCQTIKIV
jgi:hypothetical protein